MSDFFPLIVDGSGTPAIKEIPSGDVLDLTGVTVKAITVDGVSSFSDGSAAAPSITNTGDTNTGLLFSAADKMQFSSGGVAQFTLEDGAIVPVTDNDIDLGTSSLEFKDAYFDGTVTSDAFAGSLTGDVTGNVSGTSGSTTGNAATATALATARTIGGTSFDGSANIAVALATDATTLATARTIGGVSFDGSANIVPTTFATASFSGVVTAATSAKITQVAITSSSNAVAWDSQAAANAYHVTTENTTFSAPSNAVEGAIISVELAQGGTVRTIAWNTVFEFAASTAPTVTATANKTDIFSFRYNGSVWQEIGRVQNLAQT